MIGIGVDVLGVLIVGAAAALMGYAFLHLLRKLGFTPPRWAWAAIIGAAMLGYNIWNDYSWYDRAAARLPAGSEVLLTGESSRFWAPWTYLVAPVVRFAAVDPSTIQSIDGPEQYSAQLALVDRRAQTILVRQDFDCAADRIRLPQGEWQTATADDPALRHICEEGGHG